MRVLSHLDAFAALCKATGGHGIYLSFPADAPPGEVVRAAPYLDEVRLLVLVDNSCIILCDSAEECDRLFGQTVGDDGPTKASPYDGPARVYAITCGPDGEFGRENT